MTTFVRVLLFVALLVVALIANVWGFLRSPWGASRIARIAEVQVSALVDGTVAVGEVGTFGTLGFRLENVLILDPEGRPVIAVRDLRVKLEPEQLAIGRLAVDIDIDGARVEIAPLPDGDVTIGAAFAPENPSPPEPKKPRTGPKPTLPPRPPAPIHLDDLRIQDTAFRFAATPNGKAEALVRDITVEAAGDWYENHADVELALRGQVLEPVRGPLAVDVSSAFDRNWLDALKVQVALGDTVVEARGRGEMRALQGRIVASGIVGEREARLYGIPIASNLPFDAEVQLRLEAAEISLRVTPEGHGVLALDGRFDPPDGRLYAQAVFAELDPAGWIVQGPEGRASGSLVIDGAFVPEPDLHVRFSLEEGALAGSSVGPVRIAGTVKDQAVLLEPSLATLPGSTVRLEGLASEGRVDLEGSLKARDLGQTRDFLARALGLELPVLGGSGEASLTLEGSPEAPRVEGRLDFPRLVIGGSLATDLKLQGSGRLDEERLPVAILEGSASRLRSGRLDARDLRIEAERSAAGDFRIDASGTTSVLARKPGPSGLIAEGHVGNEKARLDRFELWYPEGRLAAVGQAHAGYGEGRLSLEGLELEQSGGGTLRLEGQLSRKELDLRIQGEDLSLSALPQAFLPEDLRGRLELDSNLHGSPRAPEGRARFRLEEGAYGPVSDFAASGQVQFGGGRGAGEIAAALGGAGVVRGTFDLPLVPMTAAPAAPVLLDLRVGPVDLAGLGLALATELPPGTAMARITASGPIGRPDVQVEAQVTGLQIPDEPELPAVSAQLDATLHQGLALVDVEAWAADSRILEIEASAPLDPRRLRRDPEGEIRRMLRSESARAVGAIRALDLAVVGAFLDQQDLEGAVVSEFEVTGPILDPRGHVVVDVRGGPLGPVRRTAISVNADFGDTRTRIAAAVGLDEQPPARIAIDVGAPISGFVDGTVPPATPVLLSIDADRIDLAGIGPRRPTTESVKRRVAAGREGPRLAGTVGARARFEGTLADLRGQLRIVAENLAFRGVPLGAAELQVEQGERKVSGWLTAIDPTAGTLTAEADLDAAVSPARLLREGGRWLEDVATRFELRATGLSLGPLAAAAPINRAAGKVGLVVTATGPLGDLDPRGQIQVRDGALELVGGPRYGGITLDAEVTGERVTISRLEARAPGQGRLEASGGLRRGEGPDPFEIRVRSNDFPVGGPGGVAARISGEGRLVGRVHPREGVTSTLRIPEARIELPERPPRELQEISRPKDLVIVTGPEAFLRERRARRAAEEGVLPLKLHVIAPRRVFVEGLDALAELGIDLTVERTRAGELIASGQVEARRGRLKALGRSFEIEDAEALWGGGPITNPTLSLTARYEAGAVTAWVDVAGTAVEPTISLRSEPPMPESQIALLIASGRTQLPGQSPVTGEPEAEGETDVAGTAVSVAGSFAAQKLRQAIGPKLPLDVLTLETQGAGARLEAGTYVSERLYVGYLRNFFPEPGENFNEVRAELELTQTISLQSRIGDQQAGGVDFIWEKHFATPGQQRARREVYGGRKKPPEPTDVIGKEPPEPGPEAPAGFEPER